MRFASWASCWRWKAVLESSPEYVTVLALAVRGPIRTECVVCFFTTENPTAVLETVFRLQKQWPAGAKLSLPGRHATRCWLKNFLIVSSSFAFLGNCLCVHPVFSRLYPHKKRERKTLLLDQKWSLFRTHPPLRGYG